MSRREAVWVFMEDNTLVNMFILLIIIFSTACFVLETEFKDDEHEKMWFGCVRAMSTARQRRCHQCCPAVRRTNTSRVLLLLVSCPASRQER